MKRRNRLAGFEALEARDQPAATLLADVNPVGTSALSFSDPDVPAPNGSGIATKSAAIFRADGGLWATNGTPTGAVFLGVNPPTGDYNLSPVAVGDRTFFFNGWGDLWATDGTPAGTKRVIQFPAMPAYTDFARTSTALNGKFLFATNASTADGHAQLYVSDGTAAGTQAIADLGKGDGTQFVTDGKVAYYAINRPTDTYLSSTTTATIYRTDGTAAGTRALATLPAGTAIDVMGWARPNWGMAVGSKFVFMADNERTGRELWVTDGTPAGTKMHRDIDPRAAIPKPLFDPSTLQPILGPDGRVIPVSIPKPTPQGYGSDPQQFTRLGAAVYFVADDGVHGQELWTTNGTAAGTHMVIDLSPTVGTDHPTDVPYYKFTHTPTGSRIDHLTAANGRLYFAADDGVHGAQLYTSDGTAAGTRALTAVQQRAPVRAPSGFVWHFDEEPFVLAALGGKVLFSIGSVADGRQLWATDGTVAGTGIIKLMGRPGGRVPREQLGPTALGVLHGKLVFAANDGTSGRQMYTTDGTAAGTRLLQRLTTGTAGSGPDEFVTVGSKVVFVADDTPRGPALLATDGKSPPVVVKRFTAPDNGIPVQNQPKVGPAQLTAWNGRLFFVVQSDTFGRELWVTDGTAAGTHLIKAFAQPSGYQTSGSPQLGIGNLTPANGVLYFTADVPGTGQQLWKTDGTAAGTTLVKLLSTTSFLGNWPGDAVGPIRELTVVGGRLFFAANYPVRGEGLWVSDGTTAGTKTVADIDAKSSADPHAPAAGARPHGLTALNGKLYFIAQPDPAGNPELMVTDGTAAGTRVVAPIYEQAPQYGWDVEPPPAAMVAAGGRLYFTGQDAANGYQLWTSDGTAAGTRRVTDTSLLPHDTIPQGLRAVGNQVYFSAYTPSAGRQLWVSDGTLAGTHMVRQIGSVSEVPNDGNPLSAGADPTILAVVGSRVVFTANDKEHGRGLWATDGTAAGTKLVAGVNPASLSAAVVGDRLILGATDPSHGAEPWLVPVTNLA